MVMTTSLSELDENIRAEISKVTIKNPEEKLKLIEDLLQKVHNEVKAGGID